MATYKVLQDIESEDKLIGPLTFRQCVYAAVAVLCFWLTFLTVTKHVPFMSPIFLLPGLFCAFFAFPWSREQPTELWALAKIRFAFKPRRRIWDQSGVKELVTVTAPKRVETRYTDGLSQNEVNSRLRALADTIDSRGWAVKNVNVNMFSQPSILTTLQSSSDRLLDASALPQEVSNVNVSAADDILDERNNPIAQQFDQMIQASTQTHRQQLLQKMHQASTPQPEPPVTPAAPANGSSQPPADYWFLSQPAGQGSAHTMQTAVVNPGSDNSTADPTAEEAALAASLKANQTDRPLSYSHMRTIQPGGARAAAKPSTTPKPPVTAPPDPAILELASNNDLNVATIARQAHKPRDDGPQPPDEVVISLR